MNGSDAQAWVAKADSDRLNIENNLGAERIPWDTVCYHAQQIAEKMLKACLVFRGVQPPKTHDLLRLLRDCQKSGTDLSDLADDCSLLLQYAALSRYPGSFEYSEKLGRDAHAASLRVYERVVHLLAEKDEK